MWFSVAFSPHEHAQVASEPGPFLALTGNAVDATMHIGAQHEISGEITSS